MADPDAVQVIQNPSFTVCCNMGHEMRGPQLKSNGWCCDAAPKFGGLGCLRGLNDYYQADDIQNFSCGVCDFDLCDRCAADRYFNVKKDDATLVQVDPDAGPYAHMNMLIAAPDQGEKKFEIICSYGPNMNRGVWQHKVDRIKKYFTARFMNWGISVQYKYDPTETNWENHGDVVLSSKDGLQLGTEEVTVEKWIEVEKEPEEENADAAEENANAAGENANAAEENAVADAQENANVADENGDANTENVDANAAGEDGGGAQKEPEKPKEMVKKLVSETIQKKVDDYVLKEYLHNRNHDRLYHNAEEAARKINVIFNARHEKLKEEREKADKREPTTKPSEDVKVSEDSSSVPSEWGSSVEEITVPRS